MGRLARLAAAGILALLSSCSLAATATADDPLPIPKVRAVDPADIWNFKLMSDSSVPVRVTAVRIFSGDLVFGLASSYPDQCSGTTLQPGDSTGCSLSFMMGSSGILQVSMEGALDQYVGVGSPVPTLPTETTAPAQTPEIDNDPLLEVDELSSWQDGRVTIVNRKKTVTIDSVEIVSGGDLDWAAPADANACRNIVLASDKASCALHLRGTSGTVRLRSGLWATDLDINLTQLRPNAVDQPDPLANPYLQVLASDSSPTVSVENIGAEPATIDNIELVHGWIEWDPDNALPDGCSGETVVSRSDPCTLQLDGSGVVRFNLDDGSSQDVAVKAGELANVWDTWPSARLWQRARRAAPTPSDPSAFVYDYTYAPPTGEITGLFRFGATGESQARLDKIEASVDGVPLGTYTGSGDLTCAGTTACIDICETELARDPTGACSSWFWGLASDQVGSKTQSVPFTLDTSGLANGRHTITLAVTGTPQDRRTSYQTWQIVTRNPQPVVSWSGGLYNNPASPIKDGSLTISTDSTPGVRAMRLIEVSGRTTAILSQLARTCTTVCSPLPWAGTLRIDPIALGWRDGQHWLRLATTSATGVVANVDWTVDFYRAAWLYGGLDDAADYARLENDLYTSANAASIWAMLRQPERARVISDTTGYLVRERSQTGVFAYNAGPLRHRVVDPAAWGLSASAVKVLPDGALAALPWGNDVRSDTKLYREGNEPGVFYLHGGVRYWITSPAVAANLLLDLSSVVSVPLGFWRWVPRGQDVGMSGIPGILIPPPPPTTTPPPKQKQAFVIANGSQPDTYRFTPTPAAGLRLAVIEGGTRVVWVNTANQIISALTSATAIDDIGGTVRVEFRLDNGSVLIDVFHRGSGARYPLIVDTDTSYWDDAQSDALDLQLERLPGPDGAPIASASSWPRWLVDAWNALRRLTPAERLLCAEAPRACWMYKGDKNQAFKMAGHLYAGEIDPYRKNAFLHSYYTGLLVHSAWSYYRTGMSVSKGYNFAYAHEELDQQSSNANVYARSNMDVHNNREGWKWAGTWYTRNETAICNAMRHKTDDAVWQRITSPRTSWPGELIYFSRGTTRRAGTAC